MSNERPNTKDWLKNHPNKTINDYYSVYPPQINQNSKTELNSHQDRKPKKGIKGKFWLVSIIVLIGLIFIFRNEIVNALPISSKILNTSKENDIHNQLEEAYFGISNLSLLDENNSSEIPFYNLNPAERFGSGLGLMLNQNNLSFLPKDIKIVSIKNKKANISYDLHILSNDKPIETIPINMEARKIGEKWRFDFKKFLPVNK